MGFFKTVLTKNCFNKEKAIRSLGEEEILGVCRHCKSYRLDYSKHIGYGEKMGKVFHYKANCKACGKSYHVKRTEEVYKVVKDKKWVQSKSFKKQIESY